MSPPGITRDNATLQKGKVADVRKDAVAAQVQVDIGGGNVVTSTITAASPERFGLAVGKEVMVVIKASDIMLAVEE
jgi:molybdopterin-binding protein